jgi:hypothetical protein
MLINIVMIMKNIENFLNRIVNFVIKNKVILTMFLIYFIAEIIYMRFCKTKSGYPLAGWNFFIKENNHIHVLFIDVVLLYYISDKLIKGLILTDICYVIFKIFIQLIGFIYAGEKAPIWCNQRILGFFMVLSIIGIIIFFYRKDFIRIMILIDEKWFHSIISKLINNLYVVIDKVKIKIKLLWQNHFGIW